MNERVSVSKAALDRLAEIFKESRPVYLEAACQLGELLTTIAPLSAAQAQPDSLLSDFEAINGRLGPPEVPGEVQVKHKKRGSVYDVIGGDKGDAPSDQARCSFLPTEDGEYNGNVHDEEALLKRMADLLDDLSPDETIGFTNGVNWVEVATVAEIRRAAKAVFHNGENHA